MKSIITEEIKLRQRAVEYAIKHDNNAKAARKYHKIRQQIAHREQASQKILYYPLLLHEEENSKWMFRNCWDKIH